MPETLRIEFTREQDGRWIAEAIDLPGVFAYGCTQAEARSKAENLAREVLQEREVSTAAPPSTQLRSSNTK